MMASFENRSTNVTIAPIAPIAPHSGAPFDLRIDEAIRLVRSEAHGFWTLAQAEDYVAEFAAAVEECRRRFGRARVLADWRDSPVQSSAVADRLGEANATLLEEPDRIALVVYSSVVKSQMRRRFTHCRSQAFLSYDAAELWLTAWP